MSATRYRAGMARALAAPAVVLMIIAVTLVALPTRAHAAPVDYYLPWESGAKGTVTQTVAIGNESHKCPGALCDAIDFDVEGARVFASARGSIHDIERDVPAQTTASSPDSWGNYVVVKHADDTCTRYAHLKFGSVIDKEIGDPVGQGEPLGVEGNTGFTYSNFPLDGRGHHLHFQRENCSTQASVPVGFVELGGAKPLRNAVLTSQNRAPAPKTPNVDVAIVIDSSGSMQVNDPADHRKTAAKVFVAAALDGDHMAVVDFDSISRVRAPLTRLTAGALQLWDAIDAVDSIGGTDIGDGIVDGCALLRNSTTGNPAAVVLLTDGQQTSGAYLDEHLTECGQRPVYTIGLSQDADRELLERIARETGGTFDFLDEPDDLVGLYLAIRSRLAGSGPIFETSSTVMQQQQTTFTLAVELRFIQLSWLSFWGGSTVDMTLVSPSGVEYTCASQGVRCDEGSTFELITLPSPEIGQWTIRLFGTDVPAAGERTAVVVSGIPQLTLPATVGLVDPTQGRWFLRDESESVHSFFFGNPGDVPIMGDWDCDGVDTPGMYRQADGFVYLSNENRSKVADIRFFFGNPGDVPISGDFDGDGCDTVSIYRPTEGRFFIINELGSNDGGLGAADLAYVFGNPGDKPFVGDFDGDDIDTFGLHRESTGLVYFNNEHRAKIADSEFLFGDPGDRLVAGDWTADGLSTPGVFRPVDARFYLRHTNTQGTADDVFSYGEPPWLPVAGTFGLD